MIRVFIADDHATVRIGLRHVLRELGGFEIVGEASDGRQVLNARELSACDVLVLDLSLPIVSGVEVLRRVHAQHPDLPVIVHTMHPEAQFRRRVLAEGAIAYISKNRPPSDLLQAIHRAVEAPRAVQPSRAPDAPAVVATTDADAPPAHTRLTRREHQVFNLIIMGRQVADIAAELDVHSCTVSNHLAKIRRKLGVKTIADIMRYAYAEGLIEDPFAS